MTSSASPEHRLTATASPPQTRQRPIIAACASNLLACSFNQARLAGAPERVQTCPHASQQLCAAYKSKSCIIEEASEGDTISPLGTKAAPRLTRAVQNSLIWTQEPEAADFSEAAEKKVVMSVAVVIKHPEVACDQIFILSSAL